MSQRELGYVVVEFNQASGQAELGAFPSIITGWAEAQERLDVLYRENRASGRRERFEVVTLTIEEDD